MTQFTTFIQIMVFYIVLSFIIGPLLGYHVIGNNYDNAGYGFMAGSVLSIILWIMYGQKMVNDFKSTSLTY
jgi:uncharacterized membrane protein